MLVLSIFIIRLTFFFSTAIIHLYLFLRDFFEGWPLFVFTICRLGKGRTPCKGIANCLFASHLPLAV